MPSGTLPFGQWGSMRAPSLDPMDEVSLDSNGGGSLDPIHFYIGLLNY